jgi:Ran GTPase-activating protein (RanGAP) involved in mRNA processing and transport
LKLKNNGLEEQVVKIIGFYLNHLAVNANLENPEKVKEFIANKNVNAGFKGNLESLQLLRLSRALSVCEC